MLLLNYLRRVSMKGIPMKDIFEQCHNPPLRMHGRADDGVIDQPTLFKRHA